MEFHRHENGQSGISANVLVQHLDFALTVVEEGIHLLSTSVYNSELAVLFQLRSELSQYLRLLLYGRNDCTVPPVVIGHDVYHSVSVGRPPVIINIDTVELLRSYDYTWDEVAKALQVHCTTLWRHLSNLGINTKKYSDISDDELDDVIKEIQRQYPNVGQQLLCGYLLARGIKVQRNRLRDSDQGGMRLFQGVCILYKKAIGSGILMAIIVWYIGV